MFAQQKVEHPFVWVDGNCTCEYSDVQVYKQEK